MSDPIIFDEVLHDPALFRSAVRAQDIVTEALSWVGTPFGHQQALKGAVTDCAGYIGGVAKNTRATPDVNFEKNYRRREDGTQMLLELVRYLEPVESFEDARPADILALHDGSKKDVPRHLAFLTQLEPYPKMAHASESGVVCHRINIHFRNRIHSIWRIPNLAY